MINKRLLIPAHERRAKAAPAWPLANVIRTLAVTGILITAACNSVPEREKANSVQQSSQAMDTRLQSPNNVPSVPIKSATLAKETNLTVDSLAAMDPRRTVFFDAASDALTAAERNKIRSFAAMLKMDRRLTAILEGMSDAKGSREICIAIAIKRIEAVSEELIGQGVKTGQIRKDARGCESLSEPPCSTESCHRLRRRVELKLVGVS